MLLERRSSEGKRIEDYELGYAYNEIGVAYGNRNMLDEAAGAFLAKPGFIYWMQGRFEEAEHTLVEILDIHAAAWGVDDTRSFKTGKILYGMGNVLEDMGRYEESLNLHVGASHNTKRHSGALYCKLLKASFRMGTGVI
ncbi:uncharacterized protein BDV14DRAFT_198298 [Aspergillus stella-maris]|uniref:uncharacterized protein n=1 Tax=Aspergillus stella-maris TaxID=1810926 RepID=UPI003CCE050E